MEIDDIQLVGHDIRVHYRADALLLIPVKTGIEILPCGSYYLPLETGRGVLAGKNLVVTILSGSGHTVLGDVFQHIFIVVLAVKRPSCPEILVKTASRHAVTQPGIHRPAVEIVPYFLLFTCTSVTCSHLIIRVKVSPLELDSAAMRNLPGRKSGHAGLLDMQSGIVPGILHTIHKSLVDKRLIYTGRDSKFLSSNRFRILGEDIACSERQISAMPHHTRRHGHVQKIVRMPEVLALGIVLRSKVDYTAKTPAIIQVHRDSSHKRILLSGLASRSKFVNIYGVISRTGRH